MSFAPGPAALVGRDRARAVLAAVLADARSHRRGLALVLGPSGYGKTSVVREALAGSGATVLWAGGVEDERHVAHGVIDQIVRAAPLAPADREALTSARGPDPVASGIALVALVDQLDLDPARPLVVVVDDAHWADEASLTALAFAARRTRRDPVALVLTARTEAVELVPEGLRRLVADEGRAIELEPLARADVQTLVAARYGRDLGTAPADRLLRHTAGVPIHVAALLEELTPEALVASEELPTPRSFSTLILSRLATAGAEVEALVTAAAVIGEPRPLAQVAEIAGVEAPLEALDEAIGRGLLAERVVPPDQRALVAVSHPMVRSAVVADLAPGRRSRLHHRVAEVVGGTEALRHRLLGATSPDASLWRKALAAVAALRAAGEGAAAGHLAQLSAAVAPGPAERQLSVLTAVELQLQAGQLDAARARAGTVEAFEPSARRSYVLARLAYVAGPRSDAAGHLDDTWAELEEGGAQDRALAGAVAAMQATVAVDEADGASGIRWALKAIDLDPGEAARAGTAHLLAGAYALVGEMEAGSAELDRLCREVDRSDPVAVADVHSGRGLLRLWCHDLEGAAADFETSLAAASSAPFVVLETTRHYLAEVRYRQGRWDDAILLAETAASLVDDSDQMWMASIPHATCARPLAARGLASGRLHLEQALAAARRVGGVSRVLASASAIQVEAADHHVDRIVELGGWLARRGPDERLVPWRATYVEALVAKERVDEAAAVVEALVAHPRTALVDSFVVRSQATLAAARGDATSLADAEEAAAALDPGEVGPFPFARLELALGQAFRRQGERRRALGWLEAARSRFESLGAEAWVARTDREVEACGRRPVRRRDRQGSELTPAERMVAELVTRGLTNREVAAELVISARTVEHHLSHVYAKVGVRSRTELAHVLRGAPTDP